MVKYYKNKGEFMSIIIMLLLLSILILVHEAGHFLAAKAFGIKVDKDKVSLRQREVLGQSAKRIVDAAKEYFAEMGNNAYAIFNVLSDFASFPVAYGHQSIFIHGLQRKVGLWADELIQEAKKADFSLYKYIGEEAMNTAFFLESLISTLPPNSAMIASPLGFLASNSSSTLGRP